MREVAARLRYSIVSMWLSAGLQRGDFVVVAWGLAQEGAPEYKPGVEPTKYADQVQSWAMARKKITDIQIIQEGSKLINEWCAEIFPSDEEVEEKVDFSEPGQGS